MTAYRIFALQIVKQFGPIRLTVYVYPTIAIWLASIVFGYRILTLPDLF